MPPVHDAQLRMLSTYNVVFASVRGCAQRSALLLQMFLLAHVAIGKADAVSALERARSLDMPAATATVNAEFEHADFWEANGHTIREAWLELDQANLALADIVDPSLLESIEAARDNPTLANEENVLSSFIEAGPPGKGLAYTCRLLTPEGIRALRFELDKATSSGIPLRRPNAMNRYGCIIDKDVDGAVSLSSLTSFVEDLIDDIARPVGRAFFNDTVGTEDDKEHFAFTIRYNAEEDMELKEHRDASVVTLNINLNLPEESYDGSSLYLLDEEDIGSDGTGTRHFLEFEPGTLLIHRGSVRHAALPIRSGSRQNLIIWLFGEDGQVRVAPYNEKDRLTVEQRWGKEMENNDHDDDKWKPEL